MLSGDSYLFIYPAEFKNCGSVPWKFTFFPACLLLYQFKLLLTDYFSGFFQLLKTQLHSKMGTRLCDSNALFLTSLVQHIGLVFVSSSD